MDILKKLYKKIIRKDTQAVISSDNTNVHPKEEEKQKALRFLIRLPEYVPDTKIYGCIMYHPSKSAWITPYSYPVDSIHIVHNGLVDNEYIYKTNQVAAIIMLTDALNIQTNRTIEVVLEANWDTKSAYYLPLLDAEESWEFIFSKKPIDERMYLEGYVQKSENYYLCENDLRKKNEHLKRFSEMRERQ